MARSAMADSQDQSAVVWITTFLLLSYTTLNTLVRAAVKFRMLGFDDGVAVLAQLLAYGHAFCVIYALVHGLARKEHQEADNQLRYAGVSIVRTSESVIHTTLTQSDTAGKHHTLPSGTSCCESIPGLVPEKDFPKEKSLIRYSGVQHFHSATSIAMLTLWGIGAAIAVSVDCSPEHMWILPKSTACNGVVSVVRVSMRTKGMLMVLAGKMDGRDDS
jgi:hypothetical protein